MSVVQACTLQFALAWSDYNVSHTYRYTVQYSTGTGFCTAGTGRFCTGTGRFVPIPVRYASRHQWSSGLPIYAMRDGKPGYRYASLITGSSFCDCFFTHLLVHEYTNTFSATIGLPDIVVRRQVLEIEQGADRRAINGCQHSFSVDTMRPSNVKKSQRRCC